MLLFAARAADAPSFRHIFLERVSWVPDQSPGDVTCGLACGAYTAERHALCWTSRPFLQNNSQESNTLVQKSIIIPFLQRCRKLLHEIILAMIS